MSRCVLALLVGLLTGCTLVPAEPRSRVYLKRSWGLAAAATEERAQELAHAVEGILSVYRGLEGFGSRAPRVHLVEGDFGRDHILGYTVTRPSGEVWIAVESADDYRHTLAHELAHCYFDEVHGRFPVVVEDGICELLADLAVPTPQKVEMRALAAALGYLERFTVVVEGNVAKRQLEFLLGEVRPIEEVLAFDWRGHLRADPRTMVNNYGFGWVLAKGIGYPGLVELARRCRAEELERVPASWILRAAGLDPLNQATLNVAFARAMEADNPSQESKITITIKDSSSP